MGNPMTEAYYADLKMVRSYNIVQLELGKNEFLKTYFRGPSGVYYDAIGDEVFTVKHIGGTDAKPIYIIDFGDAQTTGFIVDHGFNEYLGGP